MKTKHCWTTISLLATFVTWSTKIVPSAAYFQAPEGVYTFSIPSFNDAEKRNQYDAQTWCNGNQSKLLEIRNKDIQTFTISFIANAMNKNQMSGNTVMTNGKRSNSGLTWVNGIRYNRDPTVYGQDSGYSHSYAYINVAQSGFQFVADTPTAKRSYICEGSSFCSNGFNLSGRCYSIISATLSWYDARNQCSNRGGDLASFDFINDNTGFNVLNGSGLNPSTTYWIGLTRQKWTWQDSNSEVKYSQWSDGHPYYPEGLNVPTPYKECLCLLPNPSTYDWLWSECDCTQTYQFVCMTAATSTSLALSSPVSVSLPTTVSLSVQTRDTQSLSLPSSLSNSGSTSTAALSNSTSGDSSAIAVSDKTNKSLAIGLGVGIGGGVLLIVLVSVLVFIFIKRKGCPRKPGLQKPSSDPPDVTPESYYAAVVRTAEDDNLTSDNNNQLPPPTEYAELNIVSALESPDDRPETGRSLV